MSMAYESEEGNGGGSRQGGWRAVEENEPVLGCDKRCRRCVVSYIPKDVAWMGVSQERGSQWSAVGWVCIIELWVSGVVEVFLTT